MMRYRLLLSIILPYLSLAQEYSYTHYSNKEGLAGLVVHCMAQDKEGFLWFGTETGLSRFDGTHFKNFGREDGLPDNEIIKLFADSKGRVWIAPFKKSICYYYKGKIYNQQNDSSLKKIPIQSFAHRIAESDNGDILLEEVDALHIVRPDGQVFTLTSVDEQLPARFFDLTRNRSGGFRVIEKNRIFDLVDNRFKFIQTFNIPHDNYPHYSAISENTHVWLHRSIKTMIRLFPSNDTFAIPFTPDHLRYTIIDENRIGICLKTGARVYDIHDLNNPEAFLPGIEVSEIFKDNEDNLWFCTHGQGVYMLNASSLFNVKIPGETCWQARPANSIIKYKGSLLIGSDLSTLYKLSTEGKLKKKYSYQFGREGLYSINGIYKTAGGKILYAGDAMLVSLSEDLRMEKRIQCMATKAVFPGRNELLVATNANVVVVDRKTFAIKDTIWHERATTVFADNKTVYIGTLKGLYRLHANKEVEYLGDKFPVFTNRIAALCKDANNTLWIATYGEGIIAYKDNRVITRIDQQHGLTSNICRTIFLQGDVLWAGTDKGLNKINLSKTGYPVQKYTTVDGLASDIINAIYVDENRVFVGTPESLTFFDEQKMRSRPQCNLLFTGITISGESRQWDIFNSLNSIQLYVMDSDLAGANKFISGFSRLIRQTLDFSSRQQISLQEEIDYLSNYLELEKSRLEDAFSWKVMISDAINPADYYLPPMILQPFVENSVRHGLRLRKDKAGTIVIRIKKEHNFLICVVEDNGVGRKAAQRLKSSSHIEYQSRGMSLTAERIALLNKDNPKRITMQIDDLEDDRHEASGTRVTITFPIT